MGEQQRQTQQRRELGSTDFQYSPASPASQYGDYLTNPGIGQNFRPNLDWAQNQGSGYRQFKKGGTYTLSDDEIRELLARGVELEFLD